MSIYLIDSNRQPEMKILNNKVNLRKSQVFFEKSRFYVYAMYLTSTVHL